MSHPNSQDTNLDMLEEDFSLNNNNSVTNSSLTIVTDSNNSTITSIIPNNQPILNQVVEYNSNQTFQNLKKEVDNVCKNQITETTQLQYLSANTAFVIFIFTHYQSFILQPCIDHYKEWQETLSSAEFAKQV